MTATDLDSIASEDSFAANHIFNIFSKTLWRPTYYVLQDRYTKLDRSLSSIECRYLFIGSYFLRKNDFSLPDNAYPFFDKRDIGKREYLSFSESLEKFISVNYTVTYSMLQIAVALGYLEIYLLGMDHSYAVETNEKGAVVKRNNVRNHAYEDKQEVVANVQGMNKAYLSAKHYIDGHKDVSIYNATRGGKLEIFPRISLEEVIEAEHASDVCGLPASRKILEARLDFRAIAYFVSLLPLVITGYVDAVPALSRMKITLTLVSYALIALIFATARTRKLDLLLLA